jgi:ElaB/YqjD/DUF883 family membrane-anchored ribosome-binding protein
MTSHKLASAFLALALAASAGCASNQPGAGLVQVDQLVTSIENLHTSSETTQKSVLASLESLQSLVALDFGDDVVGAYAKTELSLEASKQQLAAFDEDVQEMKALAEPVFKKWADDLDSFTNLEMRVKSQNRLAQTRQRYDAIVLSVEPTQAAFAALHQQIADCALFLKHDLNAAACAALRPDVDALSLATEDLDAQLLACRSAAKGYVEAVSLPAVPPPAGTKAAAKPARSNG